MSFRRILATVVVSLVILGAAAYGYQTYLAPMPTPTPTPISKLPNPPIVVSAAGVVMPARMVSLGFKVAARIVQVRVGEGDNVKQGDILARLDDSILQKQIAQAQAAVVLAQKQLAQLKAGGTPDQIAAAQAALNAANANYEKVRRGPTADELAQLKANLDSAQAALGQAQAAYDRAGGAANPFIGQTRESLQLQQATNTYNAALAAYDQARSHPTAAELAGAYAQVQQAQGALAGLTPTQQAIEVARAQVDSAQAALDLAQAQSPDYAIVAPFDGTIATKNIEVGQIAQPGVPALVLGDLTTLQIETTDLAEADAPKVKVGAAATVTSDNFPGKTFQGTVAHVAPLANDHGGDKVFKVTVALVPADLAELKWGMTTNVEITVGQ
jgi:HlyD family secretion protein